jgi:two-component sensor histidine kinase
LNLNIAIPFALILNEAVSNSLKHAFRNQRQGNIWVRLRQDGDGVITLSVQDDGVGMPAQVDEEHPTTLGLRLILILAEQLHAPIRFSHGPGATLTLTTQPNLEYEPTPRSGN